MKWEKTISLAGLLFALIAGGIMLFQHLDTYAPLEHPVPENITRNPAVFKLSEHQAVTSRSLFINHDDETLTSNVSVKWVLVSPDVEVVTAEILFTTEFEPGCHVGKFDNFVPEDVAIVTQDLFDQGYKQATWRIEGDNTIVAPRKADKMVPFYVENLTFVPNDTELNFIVEETPSCDEQ